MKINLKCTEKYSKSVLKIQNAGMLLVTVFLTQLCYFSVPPHFCCAIVDTRDDKFKTNSRRISSRIKDRKRTCEGNRVFF